MPQTLPSTACSEIVFMLWWIPPMEKWPAPRNPAKWAKLFECRAAFVAPPRPDAKIPALWITLPDGRVINTEQPDLNETLSQAVSRAVAFAAAAPKTPSLEEYWPKIEGLAYQDTVTDERMPPNTFFDCAVIHVLTTATLDHLRELYPQGRFEVRRFRPNLMVETTAGEKGFIENAWVGQTLLVGERVRLRVTGACPRCVMTTWPQGDLPKDPGILRTAAKHNNANVGVYAAVIQGDTVRRGDSVKLE